MQNVFKAALRALRFSVGFAAPVAAGSLEDGRTAYSRGDYATALRIMRTLADQGHAAAQYHVGAMYENGQGVEQDYAAAVRWYRRAAAQNVARAQANLGGMYNKGQGVAQDHAEAVQWYRMAADQGDAFAQTNLGIMYYGRLGVAQNYVLALMWLNLAAKQGNEDAIKDRDIVAGEMTPVQIAEAEKLAREWKPK